MVEVPQLWSPAFAPSSSCHLVFFTAFPPVWPGASSSKIGNCDTKMNTTVNDTLLVTSLTANKTAALQTRQNTSSLSLTYRAGFARQGAKEKQLLKQGNAFNVSPFVLRAMMSGQYWPEGDEVYHAELTVPILLVHGMCDKFVPMDEDQRMAEV